MGVFSQSLISDKFTNALVIDSNNDGYFIKIKYVLGDYFLANIKGQLYCFRLEGSRQITIKIALVKMYKMYVYYTDHYLPVSGSDMKLLEEVLSKNTLPRIDERGLTLLKILGGKEKHKIRDFTPHNIPAILEEVANKAEKYPEAYESLKNFVEGLANKEQIVTPVKRLSEFLDGDLVTTDPRFLGMVAEQHKKTDAEQKKMSNTPEKGKTAWLKIMLIVVLIGAVGGIGYIVYSSGMIGGITLPGSQIGGQGGQLSDAQLMQKYSTPVSMKCAIKNGDLQYNSLSPKMKSFVDTVKGEPDCTPIPAPIIPQIKLPGQH